jgi:uncharacterized membrane protein
MQSTQKFLDLDQISRIENAIASAENHSTGEIRIHIAKVLVKNIFDQAVEKFKELGMDKTADRNGVLIFICPDFREFAIIGDQGINEKVGADFWNSTKEIMLQNFMEGNMENGILQAITKVGENLQSLFPSNNPTPNQLPNHISFDA